MKISEKWLREQVSIKFDTASLAQHLTMAGLEVSAITPVSAKLDGIVVGEIVSVAPHSTANNLKCCQVDVGKSKHVAIVSGAGNVAAGMKVPVALPGAVLPGGTVIRESEIRGERSVGMLCSGAELGLEEFSSGLLALDANVKSGTLLRDYLGLDDSILEIDLTPNRGDCLSISGIARELAAITGAKLKPYRVNTVSAKHRRQARIVLNAPEDCPHYVGRVVTNINPLSVTPMWMKERLRRSGLRSIHPVVDITNYVMIELGQPMHAFDFDKLTGSVQVRHAHQGESLTLLDGKTITPEAGSLLIADDDGPLALAGIMGGQASAVTAATHQVFLESAYFRPDAIAGRARILGLQTDSSQRFERGVDPSLQCMAMQRAVFLLQEITGSKAGPMLERSSRKHLPHRDVILLRRARIERLLGIAIQPTQVERILRRLGMRVTKSGPGWRIIPPSHRFDIAREEDLIEELLRIHGYDKLPSTLPAAKMVVHPVSESHIKESRLRAALIDRDYQEVITYSFVDPAWQASLDPQTTPVILANPIAADMAAMRTNLWSGLLQTILYNQNRQQTRIRVFEVGRSFVPHMQTIVQAPMLAGAICGLALTKQWGMPSREADFFDAKADVEALLSLAGSPSEARFRSAKHPALHPGQAAEITTPEGDIIGVMGVLHPELQTKLGLDRAVVLFELKLAALQSAKTPVFREISKFPAIRRDLAILVTANKVAQSVMDCVAHTAGKLLVDLELFDEYRGKGIDSGRKSLTLGLTFQDSSRTLSESEIEKLMAEIVSVLQSAFGATLR